VQTSHSGGDDAARADRHSPSSPSPAADSSAAAIALPERLVTATRGEWREELGVLAHEAIERAARDGRGEIALDVRATVDADVSGLGFVVAMRQRAFDRGVAVRLLGAAPHIRALLAATRLDALFLFEE
jgi:anti-anti-sigma regulatory factor